MHVTLNQKTKRKNQESIRTAVIMKRGNNKQCFFAITRRIAFFYQAQFKYCLSEQITTKIGTSSLFKTSPKYVLCMCTE